MVSFKFVTAFSPDSIPRKVTTATEQYQEYKAYCVIEWQHQHKSLKLILLFLLDLILLWENK